MEADFSGYATKAGLECSDGRTIMPDAFKHQDGQRVPLVWQHGHKEPGNVLGHAILENRPDGVYAYAFLNKTPQADVARELVQHKDIESFSIWANKLVERAKQVFHGSIREVSLVLSGANPGALIDQVRIAHSDDPDDVEVLEDEAIIYTGLTLEHEDKPSGGSDDSSESEDEKKAREVYESMNEEQKKLVHWLIGVNEGVEAVQHSSNESEDEESDDENESDEEENESDSEDENNSDDNESEDEESEDNNEDNLNHQEGEAMTRNVFEQNGGGSQTQEQPHLSHDQIMTIWNEGKKNGSFKDALLAHADEYGITNIEALFPDAKTIDARPEWITRRMEWVETVLNGARKLPFSRIKSWSADLTHEEARAKGYVKATMKKEQFFAIAHRETGPKTIYKKQKLDRDDITDITDFDVVAWLWVEMRFMLREEIARAILVGDGREVDDPDKIDEDKIRPIAFDEEFYTDVVHVPANVSPGGTIEAVLRARKNYKGSGNPDMFCQEDILTDMLLEKDRLGRRLYNTTSDVAAALRVNSITTVPVMEGVQRDGAEVLAILVNMSDYAIGTTNGGEITTFDDFDIDFNQYKYLIEGRMSGALLKHKTAQVILRGSGTLVGDGDDADALPGPDVPTFDPETGVVTIPSQTGVSYFDLDTDEELTAGDQTALEPGDSQTVVARPDEGYYFPHNVNTDWTFVRPE